MGCAQLKKARRQSDEGTVRAVITTNGAPFLQMSSVGSHSTSGREKEGKNGVECIVNSTINILDGVYFLFTISIRSEA